MKSVVICEALRTPIGKFQGTLSTVRPDDLLAQTISSIVDRSGIDPNLIEDVYMGCANQAGEDSRIGAREWSRSRSPSWSGCRAARMSSAPIFRKVRG